MAVKTGGVLMQGNDVRVGPLSAHDLILSTEKLDESLRTRTPRAARHLLRPWITITPCERPNSGRQNSPVSLSQRALYVQGSSCPSARLSGPLLRTRCIRLVLSRIPHE